MNQEVNPASKLRTQTVRGGAISLVGQGLKFLLNFSSQIVLARLLDPSQFGVVALVAPLISFIALFSDFGLLQAVIQRPTISEEELGSIFYFNLMLSSAVAVFVCLSAPVIAWLYGDPRLMPIVITLGALIGLTGSVQLHLALANRRLQFLQLSILDVLATIVGTVTGIALAYTGWGYWALVGAQVASTVTSSLGISLWIKWRPTSPPGVRNIRPLLQFGSRVTGTKVIGYLNSSCDNILVGTFLGATQLGIYDRAWKLAALPLGQINAPVEKVAFSVLSRVREDEPKYQRAFAQMSQFLFFLSMPAFLFAVFFSEPLVILCFGEKWEAMVPTFTWVAIGALISPLNTVCFWLFISQGRVNEQFKAFTVATFVNLFFYILGLRWGLVGVAMCSALSVYFLQMPFLVWVSTRTGPVTLKSFIQMFYPFFVMLVTVSVLLWFVGPLFKPHNILGLLEWMVLSYVLCLAALACTKGGRSFIVNITTLRHAISLSRRGK